MERHSLLSDRKTEYHKIVKFSYDNLQNLIKYEYTIFGPNQLNAMFIWANNYVILSWQTLRKKL